jgi:hypothetical protein
MSFQFASKLLMFSQDVDTMEDATEEEIDGDNEEHGEDKEEHGEDKEEHGEDEYAINGDEAAVLFLNHRRKHTGRTYAVNPMEYCDANHTKAVKCQFCSQLRGWQNNLWLSCARQKV